MRRVVAGQGWIGIAIFLAILTASFPRSQAKPLTGSETLEIASPAVAYQPRGYTPGRETDPTLGKQVITDLRLLREAGFRSIVTYGSEGALASIPKIARAVGFDGTVVMGIWEPLSKSEFEHAVAQSEYVDGYVVGNEGLGLRYNMSELGRAMELLRNATGRPVTTTEPIDRYLSGPYREWLLANSDWLFPIAHPYWATQFDPVEAAHWIIARHDLLSATTQRSVVLKEVGFPTWCEDTCSETQQIMLFEVLEGLDVSFFYFEAFDQPWKQVHLPFGPAEAHWGLFDAAGKPKPVVAWLQNQSR